MVSGSQKLLAHILKDIHVALYVNIFRFQRGIWNEPNINKSGLFPPITYYICHLWLQQFFDLLLLNSQTPCPTRPALCLGQQFGLLPALGWEIPKDLEGGA